MNIGSLVTKAARISPDQEVENVLLAHPAVREACVFGKPDPKGDESVVAAVVVAGAAGADELQCVYREQIATFKKPRRIEFVEFASQERLRRVLRQAVRDRLGART